MSRYTRGIYTHEKLRFRKAGPLGEEVAEWRDRPISMWSEDRVPMQTFVEENSNDPMKRRYNGEIISQWEGDPLFVMQYRQDPWIKVARGVARPIPGVNLEEEAAKESAVRLRFMNQMVHRDIPQAVSPIRYQPTPISIQR
jgi:hypothetical protein